MFYVAQAGSSLQVIKTDGTVQTLTLPSGVTIDPTIRGEFVVFARQVFFFGAATVTLWIDPFDFTVRPLSIQRPVSAPSLAAGSSTGLSGVYRGAVAYYVKNAAGDLVNLSPVSGLSLATASLANQDIAWSLLPISPDSTVTGRRLYRTAAGGTDLFQLMDIDDNVTTDIVNATPDLSIDSLPAPVLDVPPGAIPGTSIGLATAWKNRMWAFGTRDDELDELRFTDIDQFYAWNADNEIPIPPLGGDTFGATGFLPRRDALGITRRDRLLKIIGSTSEDFSLVIVAEGAGGVAREACVVIRDKAYYLGLDGVYRWDDDGAVCISRGSVDPWFTSDTYFNRSRFPNAFASWNPVTNTYELHLASAGSSVEDRWIAFHIDKGEWLGPHRTTALTPTSARLLENGSDVFVPAFGASDGYLYAQNQAVRSDIPGGSSAQAISAFLQTRFHYDKNPDVTHFFGRLSVLTRIESAGTLTATPYVGNLDATAGTTLSHDLTKDREILGRLGVGRLCSLLFSQATVGLGFLIHGYEIKPIHEAGLR